MARSRRNRAASAPGLPAMTHILRLLVCGALLISTAPLAAQTGNPGGVAPGTRADYWNDPRYQEAVKRLSKVREWQATIEITTDFNTTTPPPHFPNDSGHKFVQGHLRSSVRGTFKLRRDPQASNTRPYWDADGHAQMSVDFVRRSLGAPDSKSPPSIPFGDTCKGAGRIKVGSDGTPNNLGIQPDGRLFLHFNGHDIEVETSGEMVIVGNGMPIRSTHENTAEVHLNLHDISLPAGNNLRLQATKQMTIGVREGATRAEYVVIHTPAAYGEVYPIWDIGNPPRAATVKYDLVPVVEDLKLEVVIDDYDTWIPEGNREAARPGNTLKIRAELKKRDDSPAEVKAHRIKFELVEASDEPGTAMNWPAGATARGGGGDIKDLRFDVDRNSGLQVLNARGLEIATPHGEHDRAEAVVSSYDYGSFGTLKVTAEHPYGVIVGKLVYNNKEAILLPKRANDETQIAEAWKQQNGVAELGDDTDHDELPRGDGYYGDGLTLYQEYRGFFEKGEHFRSDPKRKDLFVQDEIGDGRTRRGIRLFEQVSELKVHYDLKSDELGTDRVINVNHKTAHAENQHGLRVERTADAAESKKVLGFGARGRSFGGPSTPEKIQRIVTSGERIPRVISSAAARRDYAAHLTHELLHSVNVYHHGADDIRDVWWKSVPIIRLNGSLGYQMMEKEVDGAGNASGAAYPITVYEEGTTNPIPELPFRKAQPLYLAVRNTPSDAGLGTSEHSGVEACFMRYHVAKAVDFGRNIPRTRYWLGANREAERTILCESRTGTGVNDGARSGGPRYGDAASQRGECKKQIRVNDYGEPPTR
jgi:hypothetical protein